jgi:ATP-dependent DNA helicase RecQ
MNKKRRYDILVRDRWKCRFCKREREIESLTIHHIQPQCMGGSDEPDNLLTLCSDCHRELHKVQKV